jgi:hypothetical protein
MKKHIFLFIFLLATGFILAAEPSGGKRPKIILQNSTGYEIAEIYVSPASSEDWGDDYLVNTTLDDGDSFTVSLPVPLSQADVYDIQLVDVEGDTYTQFDVSVKNGATVEITIDDLDEYEGDEDSAASEELELRFE